MTRTPTSRRQSRSERPAVVSIIAAVSENGVIGRDQDLPWHLPADLKRFKRLTNGHHMIMGRRTWESIGCRPLPGRPTIVVTRSRRYQAKEAWVAHSLDRSIEMVKHDDEVFIAGGEGIYRAAMSIADRIYLTRIHAHFDGDTNFPDFDVTDFDLSIKAAPACCGGQRFPYTFVVYERSR